MQKERKKLETNAIVVFDRKVKASELNELIPPDFKGDIVINGDLFLDTSLDLYGNLYLYGQMFFIGTNWPDVIINGDFYNADSVDVREIIVHGDWYSEGSIDSRNINVDGILYCGSYMDTHSIMVGENFYCDDDIDLNASGIFVAGNCECGGNIEHADDIFVLGSLKTNRIDANRVEVGI